MVRPTVFVGRRASVAMLYRLVRGPRPSGPHPASRNVHVGPRRVHLHASLRATGAASQALTGAGIESRPLAHGQARRAPGLGAGAGPLWARWNGELDQRYTLGVEEELMLLRRSDWSLAQSSDEVLERLPDELSRSRLARDPRSRA